MVIAIFIIWLIATTNIPATILFRLTNTVNVLRLTNIPFPVTIVTTKLFLSANTKSACLAIIPNYQKFENVIW